MLSHPHHQQRAQNRGGSMEHSPGYGWIIGADLDPALVRALVRGDKVLCEMNGRRSYSRLGCPLAAEEPWTVVLNEPDELVLHHPWMPRPLRLPYGNMLRVASHDPAVFLIRDQNLSAGPIYALLQFASYRLWLSEIGKMFPLSADAAGIVGQTREQTVMKLLQTIRTFKRPGWHYRGVCRFALRSGIRARIIEAFRVGDMRTIGRLPDTIMATMTREMTWLPQLLSASTASQSIL
jgi:hypothetical protein